MDWANERYVKLYIRETDDDFVLSWQALALWRAMLIKFDRSGIIKCKRGPAGLAAQVRIPAEVVTDALAELVADGRVRQTAEGYMAPNYMAAQETGHSNKQRQRDLRERRRAQAISQDSNGQSQSVTTRNSILADPSLSDPGVSGVTERNEQHSGLEITNRRDGRLVFSRFALNPRYLEVREKKSGTVLGLVEPLDDGTLREASVAEASDGEIA